MSDVQLISRRRWCGGELVDFGLIIQTVDPTGWRDVARFSVAHSNFHLIQYSWDPRKMRVTVVSLIDSQDQVREAYEMAVKLAYSDLETLLANWRSS